MTTSRSEEPNNDGDENLSVGVSVGTSDSSSESRAKGGQLQSVARALRLLNELSAAGGEGMSLTEAANQIGGTKSTVLALLRTLIDFDYVTAFGRGPRYRLGPAVVHLAESHRDSLPWLDVARPVAQRLTEKSGWTSRLASHIDGHPVFEDRIDAPGVIRFFTPLGIRELPHVSAAGKSILACLPEPEVRRIIAETGLPRRTRNTITEIEALLRDLALIRERGYAVDDEEDDEGVFCIAATFQGADGAPVGAISITGLKTDMPAWRVPEYAAMVRESADAIALATGGRTFTSRQTRGKD